MKDVNEVYEDMEKTNDEDTLLGLQQAAKEKGIDVDTSKDKKKVEAFRFDPNQPRDKEGQWTDTGASDGTASKATEKTKTPVLFGLNVTAGDKFMARSIASLHPAMQRMGTTVKLHGLDQNLGEFDIAGKKYQRAGKFSRDDNKIESGPTADILAHEMGHAEIQFALQQSGHSFYNLIAAENGSGTIKEFIDLYGDKGVITPSDRIKLPKNAKEELHNAIKDFSDTITGSAAAHPTEYSRAWKNEAISDTAKFWTDSELARFAKSSSSIPRHVNEAYAEYNSAYIREKLTKDGIMDTWDSGKSLFSEMGSKEGRTAYLTLRKAIHKAAKEQTVFQ